MPVPSELAEPLFALKLTQAPKRHFRCTCENGHPFDVETPDDELESRAALALARCPCGAAPFTAIERAE